MDLTFRTALAADECRDLIHSAAPELYDYMFARGKVAAEDYIAHEFRSGNGFIGHTIHTVAIADGEIVGVKEKRFKGRKQARVPNAKFMERSIEVV